jgi:DNA adenine methylase
MTDMNSLHSTLLSTVRVPDHVASIAKSPGGKHALSPKIRGLAPVEVKEFREVFAGSAASSFAMIRAGRCERAWLNDIDPSISGFWSVVQQQPAALMRELHGMHDQYGLGSQEMFDIACAMVGSDNPIEAAAGFYVRNHLSRSGTNGMSGFNPSYPLDGRGITRHHINYIPQFSAWLQKVRITNLDYSEVMDAPGENVFIMADPPYSGVGKTMYPFGDADLAKLAQRVRASKHACLVTVDNSPTNRVHFSDMNPIVRSYASSMGDHHAASELICANYTTPLYAIHARDIGVMVEPAPGAANSNEDDAVALEVEQEPVTEIDDATTAMPLGKDEVVAKKKKWHPRHLFVRQGNEQKNCEWYTPDWLLQHLYAANGNQPFDLDPCSPCKGANAPVWARQHFTVEDNGLAQEWRGRVWLNPPYHSLGPWLEKAADAVWCRHMPNAPTKASAEREAPLCETVVGLIPARTHRIYWRAFVADHARVFFITGKLAFLKGDGGKGIEVNSQLPEGLALVVWGNHTPFTNALRALPKSVVNVYERSAPVTPDHPVRYWRQNQQHAA